MIEMLFKDIPQIIIQSINNNLTDIWSVYD